MVDRTDSEITPEPADRLKAGMPLGEKTSSTLEISGPMLDVHAPHERIHTWKDFATHILAIVVGLLIAVGLEQTVEYVHHSHQRKALREGVVADFQLYLLLVDEFTRANTQQLDDVAARIHQVRQFMEKRDTLGPPHFRPTVPPDTLRLGNTEAAKNSGLLQLLSPGEVATATDAEVSFGRVAEYRETVRAATRKRTIFEQKFQSEDLPDSFNFSSITRLQLDDYLERLLDERAAISEYLGYLQLCHRGAVAILKGESDVNRLRLLEREEKKPSVETQ
jgi:hypothetical protein